ncbi:ABC transporter substrate-binding protein [Sinorhizobium saheli]|uniref:Peptide ABC transporter substrate-binding protein n=1 Tax=Sinorhizobium saheli TaxID=36856 RepID=A0A178Y6M0_SINSA|nr:ABC transporter substrate-binding protein [Sinorhizobium saheli]MQW87890.1 ABC transporter substrate-binding protein [Sinorhizobium saheli]OAP43087.1 peptide ABC transporter substrate-binding protein [Sinorhizobium saheli]
MTTRSNHKTLSCLFRTAALAPLVASALFASAAMADTLRVISDADLKTVDPILTTATLTQVHASLIYDKLFEFDEHGAPRPELADKVTVSDDQRTYTISLRPDLKFSDGSAITTDDVIASLKRWASKDQIGKMLADRLKNMSRIDDVTLQIELSDPFDVPSALAGATGNPAFIMPQRVAALPATESLKDATGSGPYSFDLSAWKPGQTRVYTKNPHYVPRGDAPSYMSGKKEAAFDTIEMAYIPDPNTAMAAMLTDQHDIWLGPPMDSAVAMRSDNKFVVENGVWQQFNIRPNFKNPPFDNVKAREALTYLIDQKELGPLVAGDPELWRECYAILMCGSPYGDEAAYSGHRGAPDYEKAKQLLAEAGYDGKPIVILEPTDYAPYHAAALYLAQQLRKIGANVDLQSMDWSTLTSRRTSKAPVSEGGWNLMMSSMDSSGASSPITHLMLASSCDDAWFGWPCDKQMEDLRAAFLGATSDAEKKKITFDIQKRSSEYLPFIPVGESSSPVVRRAEIENFDADVAVWYFWNVRRKTN